MTGSAQAAETHEAIGRRAAEFFERRRFGWSDADQAEFDAWLAESSLHRVGYLRVEWSVARTEQLAALRPPQTKTTPASNSDLSAPKVGRRPLLRRRFVLPLLAAASVAAIAALGIPFVSRLMQQPDRTYSTDVGGQALLKFADRTQIELNTDTVVRYRMTNHERTVWLEKGEAWFHVAHDAAHPFAVIVGKHRVSDIGTEFVVRRGLDGMEVTLLNGRAALSTEGAQTAMLVPGDDAIATSAAMSLTRRTPKQLADALGWRRGVLVFSNTRLADVVKEFNRYNQTKLVITDPSVAGVKVSAEIKIDHFDDLLELAQTVLNLRVDREGNDILISRGLRDETKKAGHARSSSEAIAHVIRGD